MYEQKPKDQDHLQAITPVTAADGAAHIAEQPRAPTTPELLKRLHGWKIRRGDKTAYGGTSAHDESTHAAATEGVAGNGAPLPHLERIQAAFGVHDVSGIRAHIGGGAATAADEIGAQAYATGNNVAFVSAPDLHTAAHEAAHVVQQRGGVQLKGGVGATGDTYEQNANAVADAVVRGESAQELLGPAKTGGGGGAAVQRFDAGSGGHQGLERTVAGLDPHQGLGQPENLKKAEPARGTREQGANAIYSGNFMQDFSQMHSPMVHGMLTNLPKRPVDAAQGKGSPNIGHAGSEAITDSIIRALAILDVGPTLANEVVKGNMQAYRPEQHVDQPQGYAANTDAIVHDGGAKGPLRPGRRTVEGGDYVSTSKVDMGKSTNVKQVADRDRDRDLAGSAAPGRQIENADLFKVSDAGLQNHIYNSSEWVKNQWLDAARLGPTDAGRFHVGAGLHAIEDYFSHSNFIEVALNEFIDSAGSKKQPAGVQTFLGQVTKDEKAHGMSKQEKAGGKKTHVDTLFDASAPKSRVYGERQAVTTGSVSGIDMKGSIGHILLPKAPLLQGAIDGTIEKIFNLVVEDPGKVSSWAKLKGIAKSDRPMAAVLALGEGLDTAGMTLPVPDGVKLDWSTYEIPLPIVDNPSFDVPTGASITMSERPITSALGTYIGFVQDARNTIKNIQSVIDKLKYMIPAYVVIAAMQALIAQIQQWITEQITLLKQRIKQQLMLGMVTLIDSISGVKTRDEKNRSIGDALANLHEGVEGFEHQTSMEARLLPGGDLAGLSDAELAPIVGPVKPAAGGGWVSVNALAPSHSEISKDHAAYPDFQTHGKGHAARKALDIHEDHGELLHPELHQEGVEHDHAEGSIFGGLARALATEADRHVLRQVELMWQDRGSLYGDGKALDTSAMEFEHGKFSKEASDSAADEEQRAKKTGYRFAQSDAGNAAQMAKPGVRELMNLVDLIIAHPQDSTWWRTVAEKYIGAHPDEVARHIRERNAVRGQRRRVKQ